MEIQTNLHGQARALTRSLLRDAVSAELSARPRSLGHRMRILARAGERGSALVEMALVLPMLLLLTTGLLVFGVAMNNYLQLTHAVNMAARTVSLDGHDAGTTTYTIPDPCATASTAVMSAAPGLTSANISFSYSFNGIPASTTTCTNAAANLVSHTNVTVTATYPLNLSVYGKVFNQSNAVLQASATELVQ